MALYYPRADYLHVIPVRHFFNPAEFQQRKGEFAALLKNPGLDLVNLDNNKDLGSGDSRMYMLKERIVNALMTYADFECSEKEREELEVAFENMQQESEKKWQEIKAKEAFLRPKKNRKC